MRKCGTLAVLMIIIIFYSLKSDAREWMTDFKNAEASAKASEKFILLDFSGSDWCMWCMKLDKEVFSQNDFKSFAEDNLVCVLVDFPSAIKQTKKLKQQNMDLARKYGVKGYPTIIILTHDGKLVGKTGYIKGGARKYVQHLKEIIDGYKSRL